MAWPLWSALLWKIHWGQRKKYNTVLVCFVYSFQDGKLRQKRRMLPMQPWKKKMIHSSRWFRFFFLLRLHLGPLTGFVYSWCNQRRLLLLPPGSMCDVMVTRPIVGYFDVHICGRKKKERVGAFPVDAAFGCMMSLCPHQLGLSSSNDTFPAPPSGQIRQLQRGHFKNKI